MRLLSPIHVLQILAHIRSSRAQLVTTRASAIETAAVLQDGAGLLQLTKNSTHEHVDAVRARIGAGANVNEFDVKARDLLTPLHWAAINGHSEITALLIENGAEIEFQNSKGMTPLLLASQNAHPNVVITLLEHGANARAASLSKMTALHSCAKLGDFATCEALVLQLADIPGAVDEKMSAGSTALHLATKAGSVEIVDLLLAAGANEEMRDNYSVSKNLRDLRNRWAGIYVARLAGRSSRHLGTARFVEVLLSELQHGTHTYLRFTSIVAAM